MLKKIFFILLAMLMCIAIGVDAQQYVELHGVVKDSVADEPVPYASVFVKGTGEGAIANVKGEFSVSIPLNSVLKVQVVGYETKEVKVSEPTNPFVIYIASTSRILDEVIIDRKRKEKYEKKGNPAIALMEDIRRHMKDDDPLLKPYFGYDKYELMTFGLNNMNSEEENRLLKKFDFLKEYVDTLPITGKPILPVSVTENISNEYFRSSPKAHKSVVVAKRHEGIEDGLDAASVERFLDDAVREIDIYGNDIALMQNRFVSPLSSIGSSFYKYYLTDTVVIDGERCVRLSFVPFNTESFGFIGRMYVLLNDTSRFVKKVMMTTPSSINLNFVKRLYIEQDYERASNGCRLKTRDDVTVEFKVIKGAQEFYAHRKTLYSGHHFQPPHDLTLFDKNGEEIIVDNATHLSKEEWSRLRPATAKANDDVGGMLARLRKSRLFFWTEKVALTLLNGYVSTGNPSKFDFGPLNTFVNWNKLEGFRLKVGGMTTAHLNKHLFAKGYIAYGFKDEKLKYMGELEYSFNEKKYHSNEFPIHSLKLWHQYDVDKIGQHYQFTSQDNAFLAIRRKTDNKMTYLRRTAFQYKVEWLNGLSLAASLEHRRHEATCFLPFEDAEGRVFGHYTTAGFQVQLRYAPGEKFYQTRMFRFPINIDNPIMTLTHTYMPKGFLGGDFEVNKTEFAIQKRFWFSAFGYTDVIVKAGKIWSKVAYPDLMIPNANLSYTIHPETYTLMNAMEFANDQFVSWDVTYWMNGLIFNRIPLVKKLKLREVLSFRGLYGSLTSKNDPAKSADVYQFPELANCQPMGKKPYMELGVGIDNILSFLRVDYVWRLTYRDTPGVDKQGLRV
ncbi:MAG: carboxypeptidase-like regulatory domain-containing protein, partial [Muribaculaceae bacterium]|nr:carboxypeptidase-like regulatory domain-containing protein [Muribaculaceae bacterium]